MQESPDPTRFRFRRAWKQKADRVRANRAFLEATRGPYLEATQLESGGATLTGELAVPVVGALYADQDSALHGASAYFDRLFGSDDPSVAGYTARTYYQEVSGGVFTLAGFTPDWVGLPLDGDYYRPQATTDATFGRTAEFLRDALDRADPGIDFGAFDNDGPDGVPNSGDDDGFVDVVAFLYQDAPRSCGGPGIWPHRWYYGGWWGEDYATDDASAAGGVILVSDYVIQAGVGCDGTSLMEIGTFSHEMGHALGLPDLYDTTPSGSPDSEGIGHWGLMGSGNWNQQASPAHLSAWSKDFLGWVTVEAVTGSLPGHELEPVQEAGRVLRYDVPGTREYFLLEHRTPTGSDQHLKEQGLLVWHVDPVAVDAGMASNTVNGDETRKGVDLEEADGLAHLDARQNRSDDGDPFPGSTDALAFGPDTEPDSRSNLSGSDSRLSLTGIDLSAGVLTFDADVRALQPGETVAGALYGSGPAHEHRLQLTAGDTVDLALVSPEPEAGGFMELLRPDGTVSASTGLDDLLRPESWGLLAPFPVPATGEWTVRVTGSCPGACDAPLTDYTLRTRPSDAVLRYEAPRLVLPVAADAAPARDTLWLSNPGIRPGDYALAPTRLDTSRPLPTWLSGSPASGTLDPLAGAGPVPVVVAADPAGWAQGEHAAHLEVTLPGGDGWTMVARPTYTMRVWDPAMDAVVPELGAGVRGLAREDDGTLLATRLDDDGAAYDLVAVDPSDGSATVRIPGITTEPMGFLDLARAPDGTLRAVDGSRLWRIDGSTAQPLTDGSHGYLESVAVDPDGTVWMGSDVLWRMDPGAAPVEASALEAGSAVTAIARPSRDAVYLGGTLPGALTGGAGVARLQLGTGSLTPVVDDGVLPGALAVGASSRLYLRDALGVRIHEPDGTLVSRHVAPADGHGMALADGAVYGTTWSEEPTGAPGLWTLAVGDAPLQEASGTFALVLRGGSLVADESRPVRLWARLDDLGPRPGSVQGRVEVDVGRARVDSVTSGDYGGSFDGNVAMQADSGFVRFALVHADPVAADSAVLATMWMTADSAVAQGDTVEVAAVMEEVRAAGDFRDLLLFLVSNEALRAGVGDGFWGDPTGDLEVTAMDALVCLSFAVGKEVGGFDVPACDVVPDEGGEFTGIVTAVDALAVLTGVVGKPLPTGYRVGRSR